MTRVNIHEAKTHFSRYIEQVEQGDVAIVRRHNKPVAEIRPFAQDQVTTMARPMPRKGGLLKGRVSWKPGTFAPMSEEEAAEFDGASVFPRGSPPVKLLLDTCAFLWFEASSDELSKAARAAIEDPDNEVYLSAVSAWEIGREFAAGSLLLDTPPEVLIPRIREQERIETLPLTESAALMAEKLPRLHRDPFNRMLIAQALEGGMIIVTSDAAFRAYPVRLLW